LQAQQQIFFTKLQNSYLIIASGWFQAFANVKLASEQPVSNKV
jgi:hypothetical protein